MDRAGALATYRTTCAVVAQTVTDRPHWSGTGAGVIVAVGALIGSPRLWTADPVKALSWTATVGQMLLAAKACPPTEPALPVDG